LTGRVIIFKAGKRFVGGALVNMTRIGVVAGPIDIQGGTEQAWLVSCMDGPRVVRTCDVIMREGGAA